MMRPSYFRIGMKRIFALILTALAAAALFGGLVHAVLVAAHVSEPTATTVYGLTPRRKSAANENYEIRHCSYCIWNRNNPLCG